MWNKKYALLITVFVLALCWMMVSVADAATYYIAANGADTNNGTSKDTPWLHAPGMTGCSNNCASHTPSAGNSYILKGGDTWHGNSGTPSFSPWVFSWSGTLASRIYIGVDLSWYSGGSWARPILNLDNPLSTSAVASCSYRQSGRVISLGDHITFDNFEMTGMCWSGSYTDPTEPDWINVSDYDTISNCYIHGWTHKTFDGSNFDGAHGIRGWTGDANDSHNIIDNLLVDGSDSDKYSFGVLYGDCWEVKNSLWRYIANGPICNNAYLFHDNVAEYVYDSDDPTMHSNGWEFNSECTSCGDGARIYNNIARHIYSAVGTWTCPMSGQTSYYYNNLFYDIKQQVFNWDGAGGTCSAQGSGGGTGYFVNNTIVGNNDIGDYLGRNFNGYFYNNHWIGTGYISGTPLAVSNQLQQSVSTATSQGYAEGNQYQPTSGTVGTVNTGISQIGILTTDIIGVSRPKGSIWDIGAYEYDTGTTPPSATGCTLSGASFR